MSISSDNILSAVQVFNLKKYRECIGSHGAIVGLPTRNIILCYPINDLKVVKAITTMGAMISNMNIAGPGSLSPLLYWYNDDVFESEPYEIKDKKFNFSPTDKFVAELNLLK